MSDLEVRNSKGEVVNRIGDVTVFTERVQIGRHESISISILNGDVLMLESFDSRYVNDIETFFDGNTLTLRGDLKMVKGKF